MNPRYSRYYTFVRPILRNTKVRTYSGLVFSLFAIAIFSVFAIKPTVETIISLQKSINDQQRIFNQLKQKSENLSLGKENLKRINASTLTKLDNLIPTKTDPAGLIVALNNLSLANNASVSGLQLQPTQLVGSSSKINKNAPLEEIPFTINLSGSYANLVSVLNSLSSSPRLISIDSVTLNQGDLGLIMSVNAKAYYLDNN